MLLLHIPADAGVYVQEMRELTPCPVCLLYFVQHTLKFKINENTHNTIIFSMKSRVVNIAAFQKLLPWLATPIRRGVVIIVHVEKPLETWAVPGGMCTDGWSRHKQSGICLVWCAFISLVKSHPSEAPLKPEHILSLFNYKHGRLIWKHPNRRASS